MTFQFVVLAVVGAALCLPAVARADNPAAADATKLQVEQPLVTPEKCAGHVFVKIDDKALRIERETNPAVRSRVSASVSVLYKSKEGQRKGADCTRETIDDVWRVSWQFFEVGSSTPISAHESMLPTDRAEAAGYLEEKRKRKGAELLPNGVERVGSGATQYFTLPAAASTGDGFPVVVTCKSQGIAKEALTPICFAGYTHPSGLILKYSFFRRGDDPNEFLEMDKRMRERLEAMLVPVESVPPDTSPKPKRKKVDDCKDNVLLQMGKHIVAFPKSKWPVIELEEGDDIHIRASDMVVCSPMIEGVRSAIGLDFSVALLTDEEVENVDQPKVEAFRKLQERYRSEKLADGVEKISTQAEDFYLLPVEKVATFTNKPAVLTCARPGEAERGNARLALSTCRVNYVHPSGLVIGYLFKRKDHSESEYLEVDREMRSLLEHMLAVGEAAKGKTYLGKDEQ